MTNTKEFKRERRYILAKVKHLRPHDIQFLDSYLKSLEHPALQAVVVESDWPNYEDTWKAIEQVANGEYQSPYESVEQLQARCEELERELEWMQIKYNTEMRIRQAYQNGAEEVARKAITKAKETFVLGSNGNEDFQAGIDYCLDAYDKHLDRYAQRIEDGEL